MVIAKRFALYANAIIQIAKNLSKSPHSSLLETYTETYQTSKINHFAKIDSGFLPLVTSAKCSILDVLPGFWIRLWPALTGPKKLSPKYFHVTLPHLKISHLKYVANFFFFYQDSKIWLYHKIQIGAKKKKRIKCDALRNLVHLYNQEC